MQKNYDEDLFEAIQRGDEKVLGRIYRSNRTTFMQWAKKHFSLDEGILEDAFQDAIEIFYQKVLSKQIVTLNAPLGNFLIGIGRNKLLQYLDKNKKVFQIEGAAFERIQEEENFLDKSIRNEIEGELIEKLDGALAKMSDVCKRLLEKKFYEAKPIALIMTEMKYDNENSTSAALSRCLKNLKNLLKG